MALQSPFQALTEFTHLSTLYRYLSLVPRLYNPTKWPINLLLVLLCWKSSLGSQAKTMERKKQNLSTHIHLVCTVKNTQQLLWLGFCLQETLRAVGSLRNTRKQVKSIFVSSLAGTHREKTPQF